MNALEIYLHIPFCVRKCRYCDFMSFPAGVSAQEKYLESLREEIRQSALPMPVSSVFIGGGTPSLLPAGQIRELMHEIRDAFDLLPDAEVTIEANPGTVDAEKLAIYREAGIGRISFGAQSFCKDELAFLGRIHSPEETEQSVLLAREAGFSQINLDLMSGIPGQTEESWAYSLRRAIACGVDHLSAYSLILEEGTPLYRMYADDTAAENMQLLSREKKEDLQISEDRRERLPSEEKKENLQFLNAKEEARRFLNEKEEARRFLNEKEEARRFLNEKEENRRFPNERKKTPAFPEDLAKRNLPPLPDEESERRMYEQTAEILAEAGFRQYEISNYAKEGAQCRHNVGYWTGVPYLGLGLGASGYLPESLFYIENDPERTEPFSRKESRSEQPVLVSRKGKGSEQLVLVSRKGKGSEQPVSLSRRGDGSENERWIRYRNPDTFSTYTGDPRMRNVEEVLGKKEREAEYLILGLRMTEGIAEEEFRERFGETPDAVFGEALQRHTRDGLLIRENGRIHLSRQGISVSNRVLADFL